MNQTKKHTTGKKLLALLLALIMSVSLLPMSVFAADLGTEAPIVEGQTQQDAALDESSGEEKIVDSQEPVAEDPAPVEEDTTENVDTTDDIATQEGDVAVQAATINYVEKKKSVSLKNDSTFYRIFLLDCGRKYFTVKEIEGIIDLLAENNFTHIELAFGNEGLRFLLDDMSLRVGGNDYSSAEVTAAIQTGNKTLTTASSGELSESNMDTIIQYANEKGIGVIPLFNAPGHMYTVVSAMDTLKVGAKSVNVETGSGGKTTNMAIDPTDPAAVNFVQALMQKYVNYFTKKNCTMFNIGADESGISGSTYSAYAKLVNSHAAMVQNAGMVAMAFNDGIYNPDYTSYLNGVEFDDDIVISYWTHSNYATAEALAKKTFVINSTHNNWYYILGNNNSSWAGYNTAIAQMANVKCNQVDSGYTTTHGCTLAVWCDYPGRSYSDNASRVATLIQTMYTQNKDYFTPVTPQPVVSIVDNNGVAVSAMKVGDTVTLTLSNNAEASWSVEPADVIELSATTRAATATGTTVTAKALKAGTATVTATVGSDTYTTKITVTAAGEIEVTENRTITVTVGGTSEPEFIAGIKYETGMSYPTEDPSTATVAVSDGSQAGESTFTAASSISNNGKYYIQNSSGKYLKLSGSISWVDSIDSATEWTATSNSNGYRLSSDNYYLRYANNYSWTTTTNRYNATTLYFNNGTLYGNYYAGYGYYNEVGTPGTKTTGTPREGINVTFKGVAVGTTYVTIGNVRYTIEVTAENLTGVSPLPIQTWITNYAIETGYKTSENYWAASWGAGTNNQYACYVNIAAADVYGPEGKPISECMPNNLMRYEYGGTYWKDVKPDKTEKELVVWSGRVHSSSNVQKLYGTDYSNTGTEFNYVRYYGGKWEVSATGLADSWVEVEGTNTQSTEQIVVYYMIRSTITNEITTDVADWGAQKGETDYTDQVSSSNTATFVLLDFAVKYEDNTRNPNSFPVDKKTFAFHCRASDAGGAVHQTGSYYYRDLNNFRAVNTSDYEVYMVTVTMTSDNPGTTLTSSQAETANGYTYDGEEQVLWAIDQETRDKFTLKDYTSISGSNTYSGCKIGGDPYIRGVEVYRQHGALITYYVRAKTTVTDALTVHYLDRSADDFEFYSYPILVKQNTFFNENFAQVEENTTNLTGNTVENHLGVTQTVTAELKDMPAIGAQYRYSDYVCVKVERSDDGKDVYLYYTFNAIKTFVVDFGLPLTITTADINSNLNAVNAEGRLTRIVTKSSNYADVKTTNDYSIIYTLNKTIDGKDNVTATYFGTNAEETENNVTYTLSIIPASTVYYEDSFAKFYGSDGAEQKSFEQTGTSVTETPGTWYVDGNAENSIPTQALEELGKKNNVYGYDPAYNTNSTTFSMGSAKKVTVDASVTKAPTATFTFKGTGFDIISLTDNNSGAIVVDVVGKNSSYNESLLVNSYYGYVYNEETGEWKIDNTAQDNALYQIPVMKVTGLDYDEYTVTINVGYGKFFDKTGDSQYSFWLDAIRVYDPMGKDYADYTQDQEGYPQYIKLRAALAKDVASVNDKLLFIDGAANAEVDLYKNYGPNNEVYLAGGQAISFKLTGDLGKIATIQVGAKKPDGSDAVMIVNNENVSIANSATEMYYTITRDNNNCVTITNTGTDILSLTNLKVTFTSAGTVSLTKTSTQEQANAVAAVRALFTAPEPDPEPVVFAPEYFQATWNRGTVKVGQKATLTVKTSTDVETVTVNGQDIGNYRVRTERTGWGWNAKKVTYHVFTFTVTATEAGTLDYSVIAANAEGVNSEAITATLTVQAAAQRPGFGGWLDKIFSRWF